MKLALIVFVLMSWLAPVSFAVTTTQPSVVQQDKFEAELSAVENWIKVEPDKDFVAKFEPQVLVIKKVYSDTLKVEAEVAEHTAQPKKDVAWMDNSLVLMKKISALEEALPSSTDKRENDQPLLKTHDLNKDELDKSLGEAIWISLDMMLLNRISKSLVLVANDLNLALRLREEPKKIVVRLQKN